MNLQVAFFAWSWDAFDFFTVSLTVSELAETFDKTNAEITWGITLVLMLRSVGSVTFGLAADRYGRKWPFIINNLLFIVLELGTGFSQTYTVSARSPDSSASLLEVYGTQGNTRKLIPHSNFWPAEPSSASPWAASTATQPPQPSKIAPKQRAV